MVRKYVKATSAPDALRKKRRIAANDCYVDDESWKVNLDTSTGEEMPKHPGGRPRKYDQSVR